MAPPPGSDVSAFEAAKLDVLKGRADFTKSYTSPCFLGNVRKSGMKIFEEDKVYACPPYPITFSGLGSPYELLDQVNKRKNQPSVANNGTDLEFSVSESDFGGSGTGTVYKHIAVGPDVKPVADRGKFVSLIYESARQIKPFASGLC